MPRALIVDDDAATLEALAQIVERSGFETRKARNLREARQILMTDGSDVALVDLQLPDGNGLELQDDLNQRLTGAIFITGNETVESAVSALRRGAIDYLVKPVDPERLRGLLAELRRVLGREAEASLLYESDGSVCGFDRLLGRSEGMRRIYELIRRVAPTNASVLITGETGTGKELVATAIHKLSRRSDKPFVALNCGAVPADLMESELFGHERGSFTGAERRHLGVFERTHGGTLFLDEFVDMPLELQVKLLRVLETGQILRVGGDTHVPVDVRVIAATNRDPETGVLEGQLRQDLLYRLLVFPIKLLPLRERAQDVELLANHMLRKLNRECETHKRLSAGTLRLLNGHPWPGNVRELNNVVERAYILADETIEAEHISLTTRTAPAGFGSELNIPVGISIAEMERQLILATLHECVGEKRRAAEILGISLKTLYNRLNSYKL